MILIDLKNKKGYENVSCVEAARMVGVAKSTIYRWKPLLIEKYNHWLICFDTKVLKQKKGFSLKTPFKK